MTGLVRTSADPAPDRGDGFRFPLPLHCPGCGVTLRTERLQRHAELGQFGVLTCDCARYPVVADIPILTHGLLAGSRCGTRHLCRLVEAGRLQEALTEAVYPGCHIQEQRRRLHSLLPAGWVNRRRRREQRRHRDVWYESFADHLSNRRTAGAASLFDLYFGSHGVNDYNTRDYFTYRWSQPRHLVPLGLATGLVSAGCRALDIACGAGHFTRFLARHSSEQGAIGVDKHFFLVFVARHYIAPDAHFVCGDVENGLPFAAGTFATVVGVNAFHFLRSKVFAAGELKRVLRDDGSILLAALRQRHRKAATSNLAIAPAGYVRLFSDMNTLLFDDATALEAYLECRSPAATEAAAPGDLERASLISMIATHRTETAVTGRRFSEWPHAIGRLDINPVYRKAECLPDGSLRLERIFPSPYYLEENQEMQRYLPAAVTLEPEVVAALDSGRRAPSMEPHIASCVLLEIPPGYAADSACA